MAQKRQLEVVTENLANCTMPGYRRLQANEKMFDLCFRDAMDKPMSWNTGLEYDPIEVDFTPGPLQETGRPLDFAIVGDGFFVVENNGQEFYTRDGSFKINPDNILVNTAGLTVKGRNGNIIIPDNIQLSSIYVDEDGTLRSEDQTIDTIQMAMFSDVTKLDRKGPCLFSAPTDMPPEDAVDNSHIIGRTLEQSNTSVFSEMAETISCMRAFEACQRMIKSQDQANGKTIQELS